MDRSFIYRIPKNAEALKRGENHLFLIGINDYAHLGKLENAVRDAQAFRDVLTDRYRFEKDHIYELYDADANRRNIMSGLRDMVGKLQEDDSLIIYFSGHGHFDPVFKEGYWVPVDASYEVIDDYIPYTFLQQMARAVPARHLLMIVDSCYSGAVLVRERDVIKERLERDPSRWIIASGRNEVVPDSDLIEEQHSPFAKQLLDLLQDYSEDGLTTLGLVDRLTENVSYNSKQTPIGQALQDVGHKGGQFIFYPRKNEARDWAETQQKNTAEAFAQFIQNYPTSNHVDEADWQIASLKNTKAAFRHYLSSQAKGKFRLKANEHILAIEDLQRFNTAKSQGEGALGIFVEKYPNSAYHAEALSEIERIRTGEGKKSTPQKKSKPTQDLPQKKQQTASSAPPTKPIPAGIPLTKKPIFKYSLIGLPILLLLIWAVINFGGAKDSSTDIRQLLKKAENTFQVGMKSENHASVKIALGMYEEALKTIPKSPVALKGKKACQDWLDSNPEAEAALPVPEEESADPVAELQKRGYQILTPWTNGVAIYQNGNQMGLINQQGNLLGNSYPEVSDLANSYAIFKNTGGKYGFLNLTGKEVIPARFDVAGPFDRTGEAKVREGKMTFFINTQGKCVRDCVDEAEEKRKLLEAQKQKDLEIKRLQALKDEQERKRVAALAEQKRITENSNRQIRVTMVRLVCELSDDEGPGNDADMDRFKFILHANQTSCSAGKNKSITGNGMTIYEYTGASITTPKGHVWRDQNKSVTITYDNEHCKGLSMRIDGYAREQDNGSSSADEEARFPLLLGNPFGTHNLILASSDFRYRCEFKIEKVGW